MSESNFAELRRVRTEMSAEAGHDVRRFVDLFDAVRARYRDHLVNHGADAERCDAQVSASQKVWDEDSAPVAR